MSLRSLGLIADHVSDRADGVDLTRIEVLTLEVDQDVDRSHAARDTPPRARASSAQSTNSGAGDRQAVVEAAAFARQGQRYLAAIQMDQLQIPDQPRTICGCSIRPQVCFVGNLISGNAAAPNDPT
jgi:hypothetical protein